MSVHPVPPSYPAGVVPDFRGTKGTKPSPLMQAGHLHVYVPTLFSQVACLWHWGAHPGQDP